MSRATKEREESCPGFAYACAIRPIIKSLMFVNMILLLLLRLRNLIRLCRLGIGHFLILARSLLCHSRLSCCLCHLTFLGCFGIRNCLRGLTLLLYLIEVALRNGAGQAADLINLGDVDSLCGVFALIIEPVLFSRLAYCSS